MDKREKYNREKYLNDMLNIINSAKNNNESELKVQLHSLFKKVEDDVAVLTYESNMGTLKPESSFMVRI